MQLKVVNQALANGLVGEFATSEPRRNRGFFLNSADSKIANNIVGNVIFHKKDDDRVVGYFENADMGDVAGIFGLPKNLMRPTLEQYVNYVPNSQQIDVIQQGYIIVNLQDPTDTPFKSNAKFSANIGDFIYYHTETGVMTACAPDTKLDKAKKFKRLYGATVAIRNVTTPTSKDTPTQAVIYIDMAGDRSGTIE